MRKTSLQTSDRRLTRSEKQLDKIDRGNVITALPLLIYSDKVGSEEVFKKHIPLISLRDQRTRSQSNRDAATP